MENFTHSLVNDQIIRLIETLGISENAFAKKIGHNSNSTIQRITKGVNGKRSAPGYETLIDIIKAYNVNPAWLMLGQGEMFLSNRQAVKEQAKKGEVDYLRMYEDANQKYLDMKDAYNELKSTIRDVRGERDHWRTLAEMKIAQMSKG